MRRPRRREPRTLILASLFVTLGLPAPALAATRYLPGVSNIDGVGGARFESSVFLTNLSPGDALFEIRFVPSTTFAGAAPAPVGRTVAGGGTLSFANALAEMFGLDGTFGTLVVTSEAPFALRGTSVNVRNAAGTYGTSLPTFDESQLLLPGETGQSIWLSQSPDPKSGFRTNVAVALLAPDSEVLVTLYDETGFVRGVTTAASDLPATWQVSVASFAALADLPVGRAEFLVRRGRAAAYTAVNDNVTSDAIAVPAVRIPAGGADLLVNGAARTPGVLSTHWQTDLRLYNPGLSSVVVSIEPLGFALPPPPLTRSIPPQALLEIVDILGPSGLGLPDGVAGALRITAPTPVLAAARTNNVDPAGSPGTFSAQVRAAAFQTAPLRAGEAATLTGLVRSGFRANVAFFSPGGASGVLILRDASGVEASRTAFALSPGEWRQRRLDLWTAPASGSLPPDARLDVRVDSGSADVYAALVDNRTGDSVVVLPAPLPAVACPSPAVTSITASSSSGPGSPVQVVVSFTGGTTARIEPGGLVTASGAPVTVTPALTTAYRATVTGSCRPDAEASVTVAVPRAANVVATTEGAFTGTTEGTTRVFRGIPFAAPPTGALRFRPPAAPPRFDGLRDATRFGDPCPQFDTDTGAYFGDEDCLTLNVWTPAESGPARPVLFFVHGGGNSSGSATKPLYDGQYLAGKNGAVVVTIHYRLNVLGWLAHPGLDRESARGTSGNWGTRDQIAALAWVRRNIGAFGGDPNRVLLFGESAGAVNTCTLLAAPLAKGFFHRALMESGGCNQKPLSDAEETGLEVVQKAGCSAAADIPACLRGLSTEAIVSALPGVVSTLQASTYGPAVDGFVLPVSPFDALTAGTHNHVPFVVGANADETALGAPAVPTEAAYAALVAEAYGLYAPRVLRQYPASAYPSPQKAFIAVTTDSRFVCNARRIARAAAAGQSEPVYRYFFTKSLDTFPYSLGGAFHGLELSFVFGTLADTSGRPMSPAEKALSDAMQGYWSRFGASGIPDGPGAVAWPRYDPGLDTTLVLGDTIAPVNGIRTANCDFWESLLP